MKIKMNYHRTDLYCADCKEHIARGEKYAIVEEELYDDQVIPKDYHLSCVPETEEDYWDDVNNSLDDLTEGE